MSFRYLKLHDIILNNTHGRPEDVKKRGQVDFKALEI
jgi:hypothetical protein